MESNVIKFSTSAFISEKLGNIKDSYKITSCIGKGKYSYKVNFDRRIRRSEEVPTQREQTIKSSQNNK